MIGGSWSNNILSQNTVETMNKWVAVFLVALCIATVFAGTCTPIRNWILIIWWWIDLNNNRIEICWWFREKGAKMCRWWKALWWMQSLHLWSWNYVMHAHDMQARWNWIGKNTTTRRFLGIRRFAAQNIFSIEYEEVDHGITISLKFFLWCFRGKARGMYWR